MSLPKVRRSSVMAWLKSEFFYSQLDRPSCWQDGRPVKREKGSVPPSVQCEMYFRNANAPQPVSTPSASSRSTTVSMTYAPPQKKTCDCLFRTTKFKTWRTRTNPATYNGVLYIKSKPGTGKSTLTKHTLAHHKEIFPDHLIAAYFFNARGGAWENTTRDAAIDRIPAYKTRWHAFGAITNQVRRQTTSQSRRQMGVAIARAEGLCSQPCIRPCWEGPGWGTICRRWRRQYREMAARR